MFRKDASSVQGDHRTFTGLLTAIGLSSSKSPLARDLFEEPEIHRMGRNAWVPNNNRLPVLIYHAALDISGPEPAKEAEELFRHNGWPPQWRNGIYDFHHYHSTAHEVLGVVAGEAWVVLGGPGRDEMTLSAGDVIVLPAGTGHCRKQCSADFLVVGAYPPGQSWDICRSAPSQVERDRIRTLAFPASDPVHGATGPLTKLWGQSFNESAA